MLTLLMRWVFVCSVLALSACSPKKEKPMINPIDELSKLSFSCVHETDKIPPRDPEADQLYTYARWLKKNNILKEDPTVWPKIERFLRIATAWGHDKASLELRDMISKGQAESPNITYEKVFLVRRDMARDIPGAYYDMAQFLEQGYGVEQDEMLALQYYRKAADMGSPDAQYYVGELLMNGELNGRRQAIDDIGIQMKQCAAQQGHGEAAVDVGIALKNNQRYPEALQAFQDGVRAGHSQSASWLKDGFLEVNKESPLYLGQKHIDKERAQRYDQIWEVLDAYHYLNPKVPEIDNIVPLPPAKLPAWNGKLQWLEAHKANVPPPLPSEARIVEMAVAKSLSPATGWPQSKG